VRLTHQLHLDAAKQLPNPVAQSVRISLYALCLPLFILMLSSKVAGTREMSSVALDNMTRTRIT
jgi:hypothetical protein